MARKRASMREGPLAELFRATEAAQRAQPQPEPDAQPEEPTVVQPPAQPAQPELPLRPEEITLEATVEHVYDFDPEPPKLEAAPPPTPAPRPEPAVEPGPVRAVEAVPAEAPEPVVEPYAPPASRFVTPMPESAPRLHVAGDVASYLAVIRVVGVGGAG
ncbi:MAG TPA: hypothetical protein VFM41_06280, partial [Gaiella sp.]|nr:hypothetical protein [Gaiella sp.]